MGKLVSFSDAKARYSEINTLPTPYITLYIDTDEDQLITIDRKHMHILFMYFNFFHDLDEMVGTIPKEEMDEVGMIADLLYDAFIDNDIMDRFIPDVIALSNLFQNAIRMDGNIIYY